MLTVHAHDDMDQYLLREVASGQPPDLLTRSIRQQYGRQMTVDDLIVSYRSAYWRTKAWQDQDTSTMEQVVRSELDRFWDRVARGVGNRCSRDW